MTASREDRLTFLKVFFINIWAKWHQCQIWKGIFPKAVNTSLICCVNKKSSKPECHYSLDSEHSRRAYCSVFITVVIKSLIGSSHGTWKLIARLIFPKLKLQKYFSVAYTSLIFWSSHFHTNYYQMSFMLMKIEYPPLKVYIYLSLRNQW